MKKFFGIFFIVTLLVSGLALISPLSAHAEAQTSVLGGDASLFFCTDSSTFCSTPFDIVAASSNVTMTCWQDDRWATYAYSSNRWFYIQTSDGREGFVHSSLVSQQTTTPNCATDPHMVAALWAINQLGSTTYDGYCLQFVHDAYAQTSKGDIGGENQSAYEYAQGHSLTMATPIPRGALVFWAGRPGFPDGHVAMSLGSGYAMSTDERTYPGVHLMNIANRNSTETGNGNTYSAYYMGWMTP